MDYQFYNIRELLFDDRFKKLICNHTIWRKEIAPGNSDYYEFTCQYCNLTYVVSKYKFDKEQEEKLKKQKSNKEL